MEGLIKKVEADAKARQEMVQQQMASEQSARRQQMDRDTEARQQA